MHTYTYSAVSNLCYLNYECCTAVFNATFTFTGLCSYFVCFQSELAGMKEIRGSLEARVVELTRHSEELHSDNCRMAELLGTSEGETQEVANVMEKLTQERENLITQCQEHKQAGEALYYYC